MMKLFIPLAASAFVFASCEQVQPVQDAAVEAERSLVEVESDTTELTRLEEEHQLFRAEYADSVNQGLIEEDKFTGSARRESKELIGAAEVAVNYGSPGKRGRVLWNGLVSYDQVWVSGSHWATAVSFTKDVMVSGTEVKAGTYAFFTIPGREKWTLILNENFDQHLAEDYDKNLDAVRVSVMAQELPNVVERLTYDVEKTGLGEGAISLKWDQVKVSMPFTVKE
ncbi:MAG: DUF2911 domain-containing protein [Flavobacteriales bacterium]|nr:DUF2911 domain-containing protein [Flavobacteriales bacterium]